MLRRFDFTGPMPFLVQNKSVQRLRDLVTIYIFQIPLFHSVLECYCYYQLVIHQICNRNQIVCGIECQGDPSPFASERAREIPCQTCKFITTKFFELGTS